MVPTSHQIVALLAEPDRLRIYAAVVLGAGSLDEIETATGIDGAPAAKALGRLRSGGLVGTGSDGRFVATPDVLRHVAREDVPGPDPADAKETDPVLRAFMKGGRLISIPATRSKRLVVLDRIAQELEPGRRFSETEVNEVVGAFHPDHATLRRYLVDEGFLEREAGVYWRSGGSFVVD